MAEIASMTQDELTTLQAALEDRVKTFSAAGLSLDMTRGKPGPQQLDLANEMLASVTVEDYRSLGGVDCRNYGGVDGLPEAKKLFAQFLEVAENEVMVGGNSSLTLMHDTVVRALLHGVPGGEGPWKNAVFLCPVPGYDRHFSVCEHHGIEMKPVPMNDLGPEMDVVEELSASDASVKGIWCVPKYSNPTGCTYSEEVVNRLAKMKTAASDFRIFWDNAYAVHHFSGDEPQLANVLQACKDAGNPKRVLIYGSTSKISFAGAGLAVMGGSTENIAWMTKHQSMQTIGPDKLNQLRHCKFFGSVDGIRAHMKRHAEILAPKFAMVEKILNEELAGTGVASWSKPNGGYFVSVDGPEGSAKATVKQVSELGVKFTPAGATFPYKRDPRDCNIRIAPTFPSVEDIEKAVEVVAVCLKLFAVKQRLNA